MEWRYRVNKAHSTLQELTLSPPSNQSNLDDARPPTWAMAEPDESAANSDLTLWRSLFRSAVNCNASA